MYVCNMYVYKQTYVCKHTSIHICIDCIVVCVQIHTAVHTHVYMRRVCTYMYTHIYIQLHARKFRLLPNLSQPSFGSTPPMKDPQPRSQDCRGVKKAPVKGVQAKTGVATYC